ncbi:hypothetical protein HCN44_006440 [Aphidius gifuensis]|uniref:Uncharacterized protein n=1 Tax=Aphidius gifuensis TaxID=684658 RepID=A0A834Y014_APHGI|nr:hypothetical protein HCN44_006440 [Aphidius gifuensis]
MMDSWISVIIEWINCLEINDKTISDIDELQDEAFYNKLLSQINYYDDATSCETSSLIEKFIKNEYPEFIEYTSDILNNNVYISSLLLLTASQKVSFHRPMCTLKNDTQVYIKKFLEVILPFGKSITPDIMMTTILEMSDATPKTPTSLTPRECRPLKNFFTSPAAQSAQKYRIINERTRELRLLKAQLETERFEKTDLLEDLKIQEDKLITLQKKLDEKTAEIKLIKLEKSKLMTPQSARKNKKQEQHKEQRLTKEIENLELFNSKLKDELDQLQYETKDLNQKLISKERQNETLKDKSNTCQRNLELLNIQLELKNNELLDLRAQNEELRSHINNMQKCTFDADQSFEIDQMPRAISPTSSLNTSEVLSTIIDIQLQEAKEETAKLQTQLDNVNVKLKEALKTCDEFNKSQELFNVQAIEYDNMKINLENKEFEHSETIKQLDLLVDKKNIIINNLKCVKDQLCEKANLLEKSETQRQLLDSTLKENYEKIKQLEINIDKLTNDLDDKNNKIQQMNIDQLKLNENLNNYQQQIAQLETQLNQQKFEFKNEMENFELKINKLTNEKDQLEILSSKTIDDNNVIIKNLNSQIIEMENYKINQSTLIQEKEIKLLELIELNDELQSQLKQERNNIMELSKQKRDLESNLSIVEAKNLTLISQISKLDIDIDNANKKINKLEERSKEYETKYENSLEKIDFLTCESEKLGNINTEATAEISRLKEFQENLENQLTQEHENCIKLVTEKANLEHLVSSKNLETTDLTYKLQDLQAHIEQDKLKYQQLETQYANLTSDYQEASVKINDLASTAQSRIKELDDQYNSIKIQLSNEKVHHDNINREKNHLENQLSLEKNKTIKLDDKLLESQGKIIEITENYNKLNNKYIELEKQNLTTQEKLEMNNDELKNLQLQINNKNNELDKEKNNYKILVDEKSLIDNKLSSITLEYEKLKIIDADYQDIQIKYQEILKTNESLVNKIENLNIKISGIEKERDCYNDNYNLLSNKYETLELELKNKINKVEELIEGNNNLLLLNKEKEVELNKNIEQLLDIKKDLEIEKLNSTEKEEKLKTLELEIKNIIDEKNIIINNLKCVKDQLCEKANLLEKSETQRQLLDSTLKENYEKINQLEINTDKLTNDLDDKNNKIQQMNIDLELKMKNIINEKNISEEKMQSIIDNLQEIRSSQDVILETQSKALTAKQHEFDNLEKQFINEVDVAKEKNNKLIEESIALTAINQEKLKTIENEYKLNLENEQQQIHMLKNKILKLNSNLCELMDLSKILCSIIQLKGQNVPIDLSNKKQQLLQIKFDDDDDDDDDDNDNDNLTEILNNIIKMFESSEEIIVSNENDKLNSLELTNKLAKYNDYLTNLSRNNCDLINIINKVISSRKNIEEKLSLLKKSWLSITSDTQNILTTTLSACDELKHLESIKIEQDKLFNNIHDRLSMSSTSFIDILTSTLTWIIDNINNDAPMNVDDDKINREKLHYENEINNIYNNNNDDIENDLAMIELKIKEFKSCSSSYEINLKSGTIKREQNCEEKLNKEKKEMKDKLDSMRLRNSKLEKNIDDIRSDNKKLKTEMSLLNLDKSEIEKLKIQIQQLNEKIKCLNNEKDELQKQQNNNDEFNDKLTQVHIEYGEKLEKIKQKMKLAYNEQMTKLKQEQEKAILENTKSMQAKMEQQCKKYTQDIERYSKHNKSLSFKSWDVSEKLIVEIKEKEKALAKLEEIQDKYQRLQLKFVSSSPIEQANNSYDDKAESFEFKNIDYIPEIKQEKQDEAAAAAETSRRQSVKSIQAMGNAFKAEDEEEVFDNVYLTDLKEGRFQTSDYSTDFERLSELRMRNSMCKPHLKSSYAAESLMHSLQVTEEDIKNGPITEDVFNDSLSQSLLPGQKIKKKDRTQTSYKRPGPPTPSKNGGRLSLQGNELKSPNSRVLKERNDKKTTATPKRLKDFFGVASLSKRQDENAPVTPKRRLSHLFRKPRSHDRPL